jgi:CRISPR system Cascade subunit CasE
VTAAQKSDWLLKRAEKNGFHLEENSFGVVQTSIAQFRRSSQRDTQVTIGETIFEGELTVTNAALLREAMTNGVGRAKAYGCGLLTIAGQL